MARTGSLPLYAAGTISIAYVNSVWTVTAVGANFLAPDGSTSWTIAPGDQLVCGADLGVVDEVVDATTLRLSAWTGPAVAAGAAYKIIRLSGAPTDAAIGLLQRVLAYGTADNPFPAFVAAAGARLVRFVTDATGDVYLQTKLAGEPDSAYVNYAVFAPEAQGPIGPIPAHAWTGTALAFELPDGSMGAPVDLKGEPGSLTQAAVDASAAAVDAAATTSADRAAVASDKTAVSALLASFRGVFLGAFASDGDANAFAAAHGITIADGLTYENTTADKFRIYKNTAWDDYDSSAVAQQQQATLSAGNAAASATAAAASATAASGSAADAATSATAASQSLATFRASWLGAAAADPTQDAGGAALAAGAHYYSTLLQRLKIYVAGTWRAAYNSVLALATSPSAADGVDGDVAIDCSAGNLYGPKAAGAWPAAKSLVGPAAWALPVDYAAGLAAQEAAPTTTVHHAGGSYVVKAGAGAFVTGASFDAAKWSQIAAPGADGAGLTLGNLTSMVAGLPTTLPASPGQLWLNGGVLSIS